MACIKMDFDPAADERSGELLRTHGLRRMASRIAILTVLDAADKHLSVAEIDHRLREHFPAIHHPPDLATIYRTVTTLLEHGVLHAVAIEGGIATYGISGDPHHHAVCTQCKSVYAVPARVLTSALESAREASSFALSERGGLTLHGVCARCQQHRLHRPARRSAGSRG